MYRFNNVEVFFAGGCTELDELLLGGLVQLGFRKISQVKNTSEFRWLLAEVMPDLLILNSTNRNGYILSFCQELRNNLSGRNPFATVLNWNQRPTEREVKVAMECGVDALISDPPTIGCVIGQISQILWGRRDFVVRGDYIGPDRRNGWTPRDGPKTAVVKVPNSLKAKVTGDNLTVSQLEIEIQSSIAKIKNYKLSERIEVVKYLATTIDLICRKPTYTKAIENHIRILLDNVSDIPVYAPSTCHHRIKDLCDDISSTVMNIEDVTLRSDSPVLVRLQLLVNDLAMAGCSRSEGIVRGSVKANGLSGGGAAL